jgi:hypothetical protein
VENQNGETEGVVVCRAARGAERRAQKLGWQPTRETVPAPMVAGTHTERCGDRSDGRPDPPAYYAPPQVYYAPPPAYYAPPPAYYAPPVNAYAPPAYGYAPPAYGYNQPYSAGYYGAPRGYAAATLSPRRSLASPRLR